MSPTSMIPMSNWFFEKSTFEKVRLPLRFENNQPFAPVALVPIPKMTPIATNPERIIKINKTKLIMVC